MIMKSSILSSPIKLVIDTAIKCGGGQRKGCGLLEVICLVQDPPWKKNLRNLVSNVTKTKKYKISRIVSFKALFLDHPSF